MNLEQQIGMLEDWELEERKKECPTLFVELLNSDPSDEALEAMKEYINKVFKIINAEIASRNEGQE